MTAKGAPPTPPPPAVTAKSAERGGGGGDRIVIPGYTYQFPVLPTECRSKNMKIMLDVPIGGCARAFAGLLGYTVAAVVRFLAAVCQTPAKCGVARFQDS